MGHEVAVRLRASGLDIDPVLVGRSSGPTASSSCISGRSGAPSPVVFPSKLPRPAFGHRRQIKKGSPGSSCYGASRNAGVVLVRSGHQHHGHRRGWAAQQYPRRPPRQIAVEAWLVGFQEGFRQRQRRQFHFVFRPAGHSGCRADVIDPRFEMHMTGLRVRPGG